MDFVHLKTQTEFSLSQGINRIPDMIKKAATNQMGAVTITDLNGLYGAIQFYSSARKSGIKPILGVDFTVLQDSGDTYQLTVLAKNEEGYRKIIELNSKSFTQNTNKNLISVKEEWLTDLDNVIVLSGAKQGLIGKMLLENDYEGAKQVAQQMKEFFGEDFYIELQRDASEDEEKYMEGAVKICFELNIPPVATNPCLFTEQDEFLAHEARYCISSKQPLYSISRKRPFNKEMYFKTKEEMSELFADLPQSLENTVQIAKKCNLSLALDNPKLPEFATPNGETADEYFAKLAKQGLDERLLEDFPDEIEREEKRPMYLERLNREIEVIQGMGFPGYFLIVGDFITWAKNQDIPVGAGRGSGAGSLVAYSMKITDIDPIPYNLLFERFLNPERVSMPDFDIDICQARRLEVYEYMRAKYGNEAVSQIGTFGTMATKAVVRDVGKALGFSYDFNSKIVQDINISPAKPVTLQDYIFGNEDKGLAACEKLLDRYNNENEVRKLVDIAVKIEGVTRQVGTHAAGVVISPTILTDFVPLYSPDGGKTVITQFYKTDVEHAGLVKFDLLGLKNLTTIKEVVDLVNVRKMKQGETDLLNLKRVNLNDPEVYKNIFTNGNTKGVFQFEGKSMTDVIKNAKPKSLEDLMAINALYRPGPMEIIPQWLIAKHLPAEERKYPHPILKDILEETYGFMIYQEQVMQCAQLIAGYSLGGADILRRAIGKKQPEEMAKQRGVFIEGAAKNGVSEEKAVELFDLIEKFCGYGFNKSHAAAYSYIGFHTAYLKYYHTEEFFTANLKSNITSTNTDKISEIFADSKKNDIKILPPDINSSEYMFAIENPREVRYGLGAIKGVGEKAGMAIALERKNNGPFLDFYDFIERTPKGTNKRNIEALIKAGAFDILNPNQAQLTASVEVAVDYLKKYRAKELIKNKKIGNLLEEDVVETVKLVRKSTKKTEDKLLERPELKDVEPWDELTSAKMEKSVLGYYFSSNPFNTYYAKELDGFKAATPLAYINDLITGFIEEEQKAEEGNSENLEHKQHKEIPKEVFIGCMIEEIKMWKSNKGGFATISDGSSTTDIMVYADFLEENKEWFKKDGFAALRLKVQIKYDEKEENDKLSMSVMQGFSFEQTKKLLTDKIFVGYDNNPDLMKKFDDICNNYAGTPEDKDALITLCGLGENNRRNKPVKRLYVKAEPKLLEQLVQTFGSEWVKTSFKIDVDNLAFPELAYKNKKGNNKNNNNYNYNYKKKKAFSN